MPGSSICLFCSMLFEGLNSESAESKPRTKMVYLKRYSLLFVTSRNCCSCLTYS